MKKLVLCTFDPLLKKSLYGPLRDDGYSLDVIDHPSDAVRLVLEDRYKAVILDSDGIGLNSIDAAAVIKNVAPGIHVITIGQQGTPHADFFLSRPVDISMLRDFLREIFSFAAGESSLKTEGRINI